MDNANLYSQLCFLGPIYKLKSEFDEIATQKELSAFQSDWKQYNPRKDGFGRHGLSLTSLDGGVDGVPDLDSIREYGKLTGETYEEMDFQTTTRIFKDCQSIHNAIEPFMEDLGRTHFIRFDKGGFFPPHRDGYDIPPKVFRLMAVVSGYDDDFAFLLDDKRITFRRGTFYFFNSLLSHSLFSFRNDVTILVMNVGITKRSIEAVLSRVVPT